MRETTKNQDDALALEGRESEMFCVAWKCRQTQKGRDLLTDDGMYNTRVWVQKTRNSKVCIFE